MISKIFINNFRSIEKQEFKNINNNLIFIGENNSGKSTVLNSIRLFFDKSEEISENDIKHGSSFFEITICKELDDKFYYDLEAKFKTQKSAVYNKFLKEFNSKTSSGDRQLYTKIYYKKFKRHINDYYFGGKNIQVLGLKLKVNRKDLTKRYYITNSRYKEITGVMISPNDPFFDVFSPNMASIDDERKFFEEVSGDHQSISSSVFSLFIKSLEQKNRVLNIEELKDKKTKELSIAELNNLLNYRLNQESVNFLEKVNTNFNEHANSDLEIHWDFNDKLQSRIDFRSHFTSEKSDSIDFLSTGSGTRSIYLISLLNAYMEMSKESENKSSLFLIEEPELYLYSNLEFHMASILADISKNNQVFISTHSATLAGEFKEEDIFLTEIIKNRSMQPCSSYSTLESPSQLIEKLGFNSYPFIGKKFVIIVEGKDDIAVYKKIVRNLNYNVEEIAFIGLGGINNVKLAVNIQFIQMSELKNKVFVILDSDGRSEKKVRDGVSGALKNQRNLDEDFLNGLLENRLYSTENSTIMETLTFNRKNMRRKDEEFERKLFSFLQKNRERINETLDNKKGYGIDKKSIIEIIESNNVEKILLVLKETVLNKKLLNIFKANVCKFKTIDNIHKREYESYIPDLVVKLNNFLGN